MFLRVQMTSLTFSARKEEGQVWKGTEKLARTCEDAHLRNLLSDVAVRSKESNYRNNEPRQRWIPSECQPRLSLAVSIFPTHKHPFIAALMAISTTKRARLSTKLAH